MRRSSLGCDLFCFAFVILSLGMELGLLSKGNIVVNTPKSPLIRQLPIIQDNTIPKDPPIQEDKPKSDNLNDAKILTFFKSLWNQTKEHYKSVDEFLESIEGKKKKPFLRAESGDCKSTICHFTGRIRVIDGLTWSVELNNRLSHRFEAIASTFSDMISSLFRGLEVEVTYLDITRIIRPFKSHINVDFDVSFNQIIPYSSPENLTRAFNEELYLGTNLGPYTLDPDETQFLKYNHQPYQDQRVHRIVNISQNAKKIVLNIKRPRELFVPIPNVRVVENNYLLAGGVLSLISVIIFFGLGAYFQSKGARKKRANSLMGRDTIYSRIYRSKKYLSHSSQVPSHEISFFERLKIEDSEKSLMQSEGSSVVHSRNTSIGETASLKFEDAHRSTLKSNRSSLNYSVRRKMDSIKEAEGHIELKEIVLEKTKKENKLPGSDIKYDIIEKL